MNGGTNLVFADMRPPSDPHALAIRVLSEPRFRVLVNRPVQRTWWDDAWRWFGDRWQVLVDAFSRNVHLGRNQSVALGDVLIAIAVCTILAVAVRLAMQIGSEYARRSSAAVSLRPAQIARDLYARSVQLARDGAYADAIAVLFGATLAALEVRRVIADSPSRTVNETRREVRNALPDLAGPFEIIARAFTAAAYAGAGVSERDWARASKAYDAHFARGSEDDA